MVIFQTAALREIRLNAKAEDVHGVTASVNTYMDDSTFLNRIVLCLFKAL